MNIDKKYLEKGIEAIDGKKSNAFYKNTVALAILEFVSSSESTNENIIIEGKEFYLGFEKITNKLLMNERLMFDYQKGGEPKKDRFTIMGKIFKGTFKKAKIMETIFKMPVYKLNTKNSDKNIPFKTNELITKGELYDIKKSHDTGYVEIDKKNIQTLKTTFKPLKGFLLYGGAVNIAKGGIGDLEKTLKEFEKIFNGFYRDNPYMKGSKEVLTKLNPECFYQKNITSSLRKENIYKQILRYVDVFQVDNRSIDHYKPVSKRGEDKITNYILTSRQLNSSKNNTIGTIFNKDIKERNIELAKNIDKLINECKVPKEHADRMRKDLEQYSA